MNFLCEPSFPKALGKGSATVRDERQAGKERQRQGDRDGGGPGLRTRRV